MRPDLERAVEALRKIIREMDRVREPEPIILHTNEAMRHFPDGNYPPWVVINKPLPKE